MSDDKCRWCGGWAVDQRGHEEKCVMRPALDPVEKSFEALQAEFDDVPPEVRAQVSPMLDEIAGILAKARKETR